MVRQRRSRGGRGLHPGTALSRSRSAGTAGSGDPGPAVPSVEEVRLPELAEGSALAVLDGETRERERYTGEDFADCDLRSTTFADCCFEGCCFDGADLRGTHFSNCRWSRVEVAGLAAPRSGWRAVRIDTSRIGSGELFESDWHGVEIVDSKLGFLNLRGSRIRDLRLTRCTIDELDLGGAQVDRAAFAGCRIGTLELARSRLRDVDLRGAELGTVTSLDGAAGVVISETQLGYLAPLLARHLQIVVAD